MGKSGHSKKNGHFYSILIFNFDNFYRTFLIKIYTIKLYLMTFIHYYTIMDYLIRPAVKMLPHRLLILKLSHLKLVVFAILLYKRKLLKYAMARKSKKKL